MTLTHEKENCSPGYQLAALPLLYPLHSICTTGPKATCPPEQISPVTPDFLPFQVWRITRHPTRSERGLFMNEEFVFWPKLGDLISGKPPKIRGRKRKERHPPAGRTRHASLTEIPGKFPALAGTRHFSDHAGQQADFDRSGAGLSFSPDETVFGVVFGNRTAYRTGLYPHLPRPT